jgi:hypothetical protein
MAPAADVEQPSSIALPSVTFWTIEILRVALI